jgi:DNA-binding NtrC family response regulator
MRASRTDGSLNEKAIQAGAFALLEKPLDVDILLSILEQALIHHSSNPTPIQANDRVDR